MRRNSSNPKSPMLKSERKAVLSLSSIFALRMFGLFMLLPVLSIYGYHYPDATSVKIGWALGAYGLTQAVLQIPAGILSDIWGRKPVIALGLAVFAIGSGIAALSDTLTGVIIGRALQGAGAISAAILALTSDLTRVEQRTKAMALIGISIGASFMLALIVSPVLVSYLGLSGLFWMITVMALSGIVIIYWVVPEAEQAVTARSSASIAQDLKNVWNNNYLKRLDFGVFSLHFALTGLFFSLPRILMEFGELEVADHWTVYVPALMLSVIGLALFMKLSENGQRQHLAFKLAIGLAMMSILAVFGVKFSMGLFMLGVFIWLFFCGFNFLEAQLPALVSQAASMNSKGMAMGVYNTFQFSGVFLGGVLSGWMFSIWGHTGVAVVCAVPLILWIGIEALSPGFTQYSSRIIKIKSGIESYESKLLAKIMDNPGVNEAIFIKEDHAVFLKVEDQHLDELQLKSALEEFALPYEMYR